MRIITANAVLFDMDGTLIDSTPGVLKAWDIFGRHYNFDGRAASHSAHGRRLADTLGEWCKIDDEKTLQEEIVRFEEEVIRGGPVALPGALELINRITAIATENHPSWTIVTSATSLYTSQALIHCGIPTPRYGYVTSDDVSRGKPYPDPYLAGAKKLNVDPSECIVIEDAPSGLMSGKAAGSKTIAVCTSHSRDSIVSSGAKPDFIVGDLTRISVNGTEDGKLELVIDESP